MEADLEHTENICKLLVVLIAFAYCTELRLYYVYNLCAHISFSHVRVLLALLIIDAREILDAVPYHATHVVCGDDLKGKRGCLIQHLFVS